ncbi:MAG: RagB/SusD family nutrient uptake outer membrane protein [Bacteroides sp.]
MKRLHNTIIGMAILAGTSICTGCSDDFLQKDSLTAVSSSTFWQTEADALNGLAACYDGMQNHYVYGGGPWECGPLNMDCMTDNGGHFNWSGWMAGYDIANGIHNSSSWLIGDYWKAHYEVIKRCNTLIDNIDRVEMNASDIALYKAEATVIRAMMYTNLTMTYNDVPYLTEVQSLANAEVPKTDRATIVAAVMEDLKNAARVLPKAASARGRITQGVALAALGRLALYNEKWDEAINAYQQIVQSGSYSLFPDYTTLFKEENEGCDEIIFGIRYEGPGLEEGSSIGGHWDTPLEAMNGTIDLADAFYHLDGKPTADKEVCAYNADGSADLWTLNTSRYENRDPRLRATLFIPGMAWNDKDWYYGGAAASYSTIYVMKYFNPALSWSTSWDDGQDFYVFRYAEVLLSLAEAYIEKDDRLDEATRLINQVRARAGMPSVEEAEGNGLSQAGLREVVRHERRVELAFEGLRLFDLYRWHLLKDAVDRVNAEASTYNFWYEYRNYRGEQEYEWPIPQTEIDCNAQLEQNILWQ